MNRIYIFLVVLIVGISSCKKKKTDTPVVTPVPQTLEVHLVPKMDGQDYTLNQVITSNQGYKYYFTAIKILGTDLANGTNVLSTSYFYNFGENGTLMRSEIGNKSNFNNLSFNIGVPNALNHGDPSTPPSTSALNISNAGDMHWGWNPGYIFVKLEGKVDTTANGIDDFDHNFVFHLGTDAIFRTLNFTDVTWNSAGENKIRTNFNLMVKDIFDKSGNEVDLRVDYTSHSSSSQMALSNAVVDKLQNAIQKE